MSKVALASAVAALTSSALAQEIPNRTALEVLLGANLILEDFETFQMPADATVSLDAEVLDATTVTNHQGPGLVEPGASYWAPPSNLIHWNGDGWYGITTQSFFINFTCGSVHIEYDPPVQAFGVDLANILPGLPCAGFAQVIDQGGSNVGLAHFAVGDQPGDRTFVGWRHDPGISEVVLHSLDTFWSPILDDHGYGRIDSTIGSSFCQALSNSTGVPSRLKAYGSEVASYNEVMLLATHLPTNEPGYVLNALDTDQKLIGSGVLCLGGTLGRHVAQVANSGDQGTISTPLDLTSLPRPGGVHSVTAGERWYFQLWHRDGQTSNLTDAVGITFQ